MNDDKLQQQLLQAARNAPVSDHVPLAFEKRVMARLRSRGPVDAWDFWSRSLWRGALACVAVAAVVGVWGFQRPAAPENFDLATQLENSIYASMTADLEELW